MNGLLRSVPHPNQASVITTMSGVSSNPPRDAGGRQSMSDQRQKILVTGWRKYVFTADRLSLTLYRAGKSSCIKTVFQNLPVKDVPYIGITQKLEKVDYEYVFLSQTPS